MLLALKPVVLHGNNGNCWINEVSLTQRGYSRVYSNCVETSEKPNSAPEQLTISHRHGGVYHQPRKRESCLLAGVCQTPLYVLPLPGLFHAAHAVRGYICHRYDLNPSATHIKSDISLLAGITHRWMAYSLHIPFLHYSELLSWGSLINLFLCVWRCQFLLLTLEYKLLKILFLREGKNKKAKSHFFCWKPFSHSSHSSGVLLCCHL